MASSLTEASGKYKGAEKALLPNDIVVQVCGDTHKNKAITLSVGCKHVTVLQDYSLRQSVTAFSMCRRSSHRGSLAVDLLEDRGRGRDVDSHLSIQAAMRPSQLHAVLPLDYGFHEELRGVQAGKDLPVWLL
jgi:hypothetical protein